MLDWEGVRYLSDFLMRVFLFPSSSVLSSCSRVSRLPATGFAGIFLGIFCLRWGVSFFGFLSLGSISRCRAFALRFRWGSYPIGSGVPIARGFDFAPWRRGLAPPASGNHGGKASRVPVAGASSVVAPFQDWNRPPPNSWSSLFAKAPSCNTSCSLMKSDVKCVGGVLDISVPDEELAENCSFWENTLVGHFIGFWQNFLVLKQKAVQMWKPKGELEIYTLPAGFILFCFGLADDKMTVLEKGPWFISGKVLILKPWTPDDELSRVDLSSIPIWIRIHNLPLKWWSPGIIGQVASALRRPLSMDVATSAKSRLGFARVCVEMEAVSDFLEELSVIVNGGPEAYIRFEYEVVPSRCTKCNLYCHNTKSCAGSGQAPVSQAWQMKSNHARMGVAGSESTAKPLVEGSQMLEVAENSSQVMLVLVQVPSKGDVPAQDHVAGEGSGTVCQEDLNECSAKSEGIVYKPSPCGIDNEKGKLTVCLISRPDYMESEDFLEKAYMEDPQEKGESIITSTPILGPKDVDEDIDDLELGDIDCPDLPVSREEAGCLLDLQYFVVRDSGQKRKKKNKKKTKEISLLYGLEEHAAI